MPFSDINYIQNVQSSPLSVSTTWHGLHMLMDILGKTKYQGHFGMDQMPYGCFGQD